MTVKGGYAAVADIAARGASVAVAAGVWNRPAAIPFGAIPWGT
jgi:hypothetical protein